MNKKICDLCCVAVARVLCESDDAALCWGCDAAVHGANFLVARHVRVLMCRVCLSRTAWLASGARVGPAASLCCRCSERKEHSGIVDGGDGGDGEVENQVVPLKLAPPLSDDSSSSSTLPADDLSCASTQSSNSRSTEAESGVAEHEATSDDATSSSSDSKSKQSKRRKRSFAATLVHATSSSKFKL